MECHKCVHQEAMEAGKFRGVAFEKTPCAACELVESSEFTMEFDEGRAAAAPAAASAVELGEERVPLSVLSEVVARLLSLDPVTRNVVCWRHSGMKYQEIGRLLGVSTSAAEERLARVLRRWPALKALFHGKAGFGRRRGRGGNG